MNRSNTADLGAILAIILAILATALVFVDVKAADRPTDGGTVLPAECPRLNCDPVPCEWYPGGWPFETPESIADPSTWWQHDPNGTCAVEVPGNAPKPDPTPKLTMPPTDTAP